jgi:hypothetical protein
MAHSPAPTQRRPAAVPGRPAADLFVVSTHKVRDRSGGAPYDWVPYGREHAWAAGTRRTLCGEWTTGWTVFWELRFTASRGAACPRCVEASLPEASRRRLDALPSTGA